MSLHCRCSTTWPQRDCRARGDSGREGQRLLRQPNEEQGAKRRSSGGSKEVKQWHQGGAVARGSGYDSKGNSGKGGGSGVVRSAQQVGSSKKQLRKGGSDKGKRRRMATMTGGSGGIGDRGGRWRGAAVAVAMTRSVARATSRGAAGALTMGSTDVAVGGEEWLVAAIEEESKAATGG
ncbi:hypothetical protein B296_00004811 [Ensete ventricosum]|uniref:Uncharacterized protein n=1 Tax=Ensete ventricosum TaxID=4639 RepID=A0A427A630_ENSVE|nr:hypothetical protein B296_00004811 [Ensete ventricosum]